MEQGLIHIYCGDGKGKTSAAIGLAVRAAGSGLKVLFTRFLKNESSGELEIVLTGRNPDEKLVELADYVSEIKKVKHPFDQGIYARKGIEY